MTLATLLWTWTLIAAVCAATCFVALLVGARLDAAEARRSRRQWQRMCEALDCEDLFCFDDADGRGRYSYGRWRVRFDAFSA